jgi:hypothetical protein
VQENDIPVERPVPDLESRPITLDQYHALTPEKLELIEGYLVGPPDWRYSSEKRRNLLLLLLVNEGLLEAVRLAPPELWRAALGQVYGEP